MEGYPINPLLLTSPPLLSMDLLHPRNQALLNQIKNASTTQSIANSNCTPITSTSSPPIKTEQSMAQLESPLKPSNPREHEQDLPSPLKVGSFSLYVFIVVMDHVSTIGCVFSIHWYSVRFKSKRQESYAHFLPQETLSNSMHTNTHKHFLP